MYVGTVRFYKNLILLIVLILIATPTVLAVRYHSAYRRADAALQAAEATADPRAEQEADYSADAPAYQALYPDFYAPQELCATRRTPNTVYLTFDDGPSDYTDQILDVLAEEDVKATFFVVGVTTKKDLNRLRRIVNEGHTLGMHSYCHKYDKIYESVEAYLADMYKIFTLIKDTTGVAPTVFRFPGGSVNGYNQGTYQEMISEMLRRGFVPYDWNLSSEDAMGRSCTTAELVERSTKNLASKERAFLLMHDTYKHTANAVRPVIQAIKKQGFTFEPITPDVLPLLYKYKK